MRDSDTRPSAVLPTSPWILKTTNLDRLGLSGMDSTHRLSFTVLVLQAGRKRVISSEQVMCGHVASGRLPLSADQL